MLRLISAQLVNGIAIGMIYALMAFGLSIIKGLLNIPNFAHGALYALGAYLCYTAVAVGLPFPAGLVVAAAGAAVAGLVLDRHQGRETHYRAQPQCLAPLIDWMRIYAAFWRERFDRLESLLDSMAP